GSQAATMGIAGEESVTMPTVCRAAHTRACQSPKSCSVWGRRGSASTHVLHPYTQFLPLGCGSGTGHPVVYGCRHISQRGPFIRVSPDCAILMAHPRTPNCLPSPSGVGTSDTIRRAGACYENLYPCRTVWETKVVRAM